MIFLSGAIIEFLHRLQFHAVDAEVMQIKVRALHPFAQAGEAQAFLRGGIDGRVRGQIAHMHLGHDQVLPLRGDKSTIGGIQSSAFDDNARTRVVYGGKGIGIQNLDVRIKSPRGIPHPVELIPVIRAMPVTFQCRFPHIRFVRIAFEFHDLHRRRVSELGGDKQFHFIGPGGEQTELGVTAAHHRPHRQVGAK